jgi:cyanophycinase-like exopeptidase
VSGRICLQGGGEFSPGCRDMDAAVLEQAQGPVVVTALAGEVGLDYRAATGNGVRHLQALASLEVRAAPDARTDREEALRALREARTVVLPGGSPSRLLEALQDTGVAALLAELVTSGGTLIGSSAGAMVLGSWTVLPDRRAGLAVVPGLGLAARLVVVPHWSGAGPAAWLQAIERTVPRDVTVLGLAEESGVLVQDGSLTALGRTPSTLVREERELPPAQTWRVR